ncbi:hypothetical protein [Streptomyces sp. NPDC054765]
MVAVLTADQIERFAADGSIRLPEAFPRPRAGLGTFPVRLPHPADPGGIGRHMDAQVPARPLGQAYPTQLGHRLPHPVPGSPTLPRRAGVAGAESQRAPSSGLLF